LPSAKVLVRGDAAQEKTRKNGAKSGLEWSTTSHLFGWGFQRKPLHRKTATKKKGRKKDKPSS